MPDDKAQVILRDLVDRYGSFSSSDDDRRRCRGLLRDLAGSYTLEVNLLLRALESGASEQLTAGRTNLGLVTPRLVRELQDTYGISAENAAWSVDAWVYALGLKPVAAEPNRKQPETAVAVPVPREQQRVAAEQARQGAAEETRQKEAAEQVRQRAVAEAAHRQQTAPIWQQIGIEMVQIPAGEFLYGDDKKRVKLDAYAIAKTLVTNRQYKAFVDATGHRTPNHWQGGKIPAGKQDHPVVHVSWDDAVAFSQWAGVALPSEQQWEKAARGTDGRTYPWGDVAPDKSRCNFNKDVGDTTLVGKYPAGANGLFDMAGNVWEWCNDQYEKGGRVIRGGAWYIVNEYLMRCAFRGGNSPGFQYVALGFRVVPPDLAAAAARLAAEKRRQEAAEQERQRDAAEAVRRQQATSIWHQIGIEMVQIPAGVFLYGEYKKRVMLDAYAIAKTPVTNRQYKAFVDATRNRAPDHWRGGKIPAGKEDHPVVRVSWDDALAFCQWAGVTLPSEQQWEKAARGTDGRIFPWGNEPAERKRCNFNSLVGDTTPVGEYPAGASPWGVMDMSGNVWEWCKDRESTELRGGSYRSEANWVRCAVRHSHDPVNRDDPVGFRVLSPGS